jgi:uncharacterized protein
MFSRLIRGAGLVLAGLLMAAPAIAQTFPPLTGRVVDDAHLLSADQVQQLTDLSQQIETASSRQFVVATIPDLQGYPIEDFGYKLGRDWKIGQAGANNGIILIVAPKERKVRIEVGYGLEPIMTDALSSVIINQTILPKFRSGDMAGGIVDGANAIAAQMKLPQEAAEQRAQQVVSEQKTHEDNGNFPVTLIFWGVMFLFFFVIPAIRGRNGRHYGGSGLGSAILWGSALGNSGGSSWGGGGSSWGGGGGFSGGGGSFGGGGASGGW